MILVDANILVYAWDIRAQQHEAARMWLDDRLSGSARVALPWESTPGFLRVVTSPRIYKHLASVAWAQVREWLACENVWIPSANEEHGVVPGGLLRELGGGAKLIPDAHLATLAVEHGLVRRTGTSRVFLGCGG